MRLLRAVVRSEGVTALVATHDPALIDLADAVLLLEDGKIAAPVAGYGRRDSRMFWHHGRTNTADHRLRAQATTVPVVAVRFW